MSKDSQFHTEYVEYDADRNTYRAHYGESLAAPSTVVAQTVAALEDERVEDIRPLQDAVNADALDELFVPLDTVDDPTGVEISFTYYDYDVTVNSSGVVELAALDDTR